MNLIIITIVADHRSEFCFLLLVDCVPRDRWMVAGRRRGSLWLLCWCWTAPAGCKLEDRHASSMVCL